MTPEEFITEWQNEAPTIIVHTSGSTGTPKTYHVEKTRMLASAHTTCEILGLKAGDTALLCMPVDFIAGKMMIVRAISQGLNLTSIAPTGHPLASVGDNGFDFVAMVPLQVYNTLSVPEEAERLSKVRHLIIGGGALDDELESRLKTLPNAVWSTYGMTETLSHIALRRINGIESTEWYTPVSNVRVWLDKDSRIVISAPDVCSETLTTNDIGQMHTDGRRFRIIGRYDNVICSGGMKVHIEEIEAALKPLLRSPFMITKCPDEKFGEAITILYTEGKESEIREICIHALPKYSRPRIYYKVDKLPYTATGKPARAEAQKIAEDMLMNARK